MKRESGPLLILADDFTGACDAAGAFASTRHAVVILHMHASRALASAADPSAEQVTALDLDVRDRSDAVARSRAKEATRSLLSRPRGRLLLKIDSTLRGPISGLVHGSLAASGAELAIIATAFPEHGRLLIGGRLMLDGQPGASLIDLLDGDRTALLPASCARTPQAIEAAVYEAQRRGSRRIIVDADGPECLRSIADAWVKHAEWLLVGSAGLARQVAVAHASPRALPSSEVQRSAPARSSGPVLVVAGSPADATRVQLQQLELTESPNGVEVVVLATPPTRARDSGEAAERLAKIVRAWAAQASPGGVVLAGGATARAVCEEIEADGILLQGEVSPGIPYGRILGGEWDGVAVITKAGGFGGPGALLDAVQALGVSSTPDDDHN